MKPIKIEVKDLEIDLQNHTVSEKLIPGPKGEDGKDGETPTEEQLLALILPNIPKPKNGKDGKSITKTEVKEIIKSVLPEDKLIEKIVKKIPVPKDGEDGKSFRFADLTAYEKQILTGPPGSTGVGVPRGGTANQVLSKKSSKDFDTEWVTGGGGGGAVDSVNGQTGVVVLDQDDIGDGTTYKQYSATEKTKLAGIESGAEVNTIDTVSDTTEIDLAITARDLTATIRAGSIDESKLDTSVNTSLGKADTAVQPATLSSYEVLSNKSTDTALGTSDTLYPTQNAVKTYVDNSVVGLLDDRGNYDASVNTFPASGGSGTAGAILKGDSWFINVAGTLGGAPVVSGDNLRALVDTPGQTASNWSVLEGNIGYVPENVANKENTTIDTNTTKYPTVNLLKTGLDTKQATLVSGTNIKTVNSTTLLGSGDLAVATTAQGALADTALQPANISDTAYDATSWNGVTTIAPSKNAIRDKIETMDAAIALNTAKVTNATHTGDVTGATALTIANSAVTLAKMADLAQDQFIGRTSASTGVPQTATITAAARTVLDDTTVGAMVDTLGGATSTGTGGLVRAGSPALTTPSIAAITVSGGILTLPTGASDTLVSKNSTDTLTNKSISGGQITSAVATATTATGTNALYSATTTVNVSSATAPTSGQVLTATSSTAATWQTPTGGGNPGWDFISYNTASAASSITVSGLNLNTDGGMYQVIVKAEGSTACDYNMQFNAETGGYAWGITRNSFNGSTWTMNSSANNTGSDSGVFLAGSAADVKSLSSVIYLSEILKFDGTNTQIVADYTAIGTGTAGSNDAFEKNVGTGFTTNIEANITSLKFLASAGTQNWKVWVSKAAVS